MNQKRIKVGWDKLPHETEQERQAFLETAMKSLMEKIRKNIDVFKRLANR